jgi:thiol-disulfide isomerase/thioredoxin
MHKTIIAIAIIVSLIAVSSAAALAVGDKAPPLRVGEWIRPSPVDLLDTDPEAPKPFFLIEFWATWCEPCRLMMPHINDLQRKYAGAGFVVIAISTEPAHVVGRFVNSMGPAMNYAVVVDTDNRDTYNAYMRAVGAPGIPHAFLVDRDGKLVWYGVPSGKEIDPLIERLAGKDYTLKSEQLAERAERLIARYFATLKRGDAKEAAKLGERIVEWGRARPGMLREFAWRILTEPGIEARDAETALNAATVAVSATPDDFRVLETLALAQFESGQIPEAVETQKRAIAACNETTLHERLKETLDTFVAQLPESTDAGDGVTR